MNRCLPSILIVVGMMQASGAEKLSFTQAVYPVLQRAECRTCHNPEGVASATRLRYPDEGAPKARVEAFGKSLVELVDRRAPDKSLLFLKPTNRIPHTGGERIPKGSADETTLRAWIAELASMSPTEVAN